MTFTGFGLADPVIPPAPENVATTFRASVIATVQLPVPVHAPLHPAKVEPVRGVAVNVTFVP
jgi:hypothetical protein